MHPKTVCRPYGMYDNVYQVILAYWQIMRTSKYKPVGPGIPGTKAKKSVRTREPKYTIVAFRRVSAHIFFICECGPVRKQLPQRAMIFPIVAFSTKGTTEVKMYWKQFSRSKVSRRRCKLSQIFFKRCTYQDFQWLTLSLGRRLQMTRDTPQPYKLRTQSSVRSRLTWVGVSTYHLQVLLLAFLPSFASSEEGWQNPYSRTC